MLVLTSTLQGYWSKQSHNSLRSELFFVNNLTLDKHHITWDTAPYDDINAVVRRKLTHPKRREGLFQHRTRKCHTWTKVTTPFIRQGHGAELRWWTTNILLPSVCIYRRLYQYVFVYHPHHPSQEAADLSQQAKTIQQAIGCSNIGAMTRDKLHHYYPCRDYCNYDDWDYNDRSTFHVTLPPQLNDICNPIIL
jgi:hypothetical protein